jgi:hypothetical protein
MTTDLITAKEAAIIRDSQPHLQEIFQAIKYSAEDGGSSCTFVVDNIPVAGRIVTVLRRLGYDFPKSGTTGVTATTGIKTVFEMEISWAHAEYGFDQAQEQEKFIGVLERALKA